MSQLEDTSDASVCRHRPGPRQPRPPRLLGARPRPGRTVRHQRRLQLRGRGRGRDGGRGGTPGQPAPGSGLWGRGQWVQ